MNRWERLRRWFRRRVRAQEIIDAALALIAVVLGVIAGPQATAWVACLLTGYVVLVALEVWMTWGERGAIEKLKGEIFWGLFHHVNEVWFGGSTHTRFTLFLPDERHQDTIAPRYRYRKNGAGAIVEAEKSNARYKRSEGLTGQAWREASEEHLSLVILPEFANRKELENFYVGTLDVSQETVKRISDHMLGVRVIISIGYTDTRGKFIGVLSVDVEEPIECGENDAILFEESSVELDGPLVHVLSEAIRNVLRSISSVL